jgi:hypothetical protein
MAIVLSGGCNSFTKLFLESGDRVGRKCVGLDVANLIIFISKIGEKNSYKPQNISCFFHFLEN